MTAKSERKFMAEDKKKKMAVIEITEEYMKHRLYVFRGKKVMLVKNNIAKFEGDDFMCLQSREYICL